jgi:ligand-binding sensor domain-containing protein
MLAGAWFFSTAGPTPELPAGWQVIRPPHDVFALAIQDDSVWAGGQDGVYRLDRESGEILEKLERDPPIEHVRALLVDQDGALWIGSYQGLFRYDAGGWSTYTSETGLPDTRVNALQFDRNGRLWAGTWGGAAILEDGRWHVLQSQDGLLADMVNVLLEDWQGNIWFGSYIAPRGGLSIRLNSRWQTFTTANGLPHNNITSLLEASPGRVWLGSGLLDRGGAALFEYDGGRWQIREILEQEDGLAGEKVRSIFQDRNGGLWFGSEYDGVAVLHGGHWTYLHTGDGLSHPEVKTFLQDDQGNLWLGTRDGITRIDAQALNKLYTGN